MFPSVGQSPLVRLRNGRALLQMIFGVVRPELLEVLHGLDLRIC